MEKNIVVVSRQNIYPFVQECFLDTGFADDEISIFNDCNEAVNAPLERAHIVLFHLENAGSTHNIEALPKRFTTSPIIVLAAPEDEEQALALLKYGADDYILKTEATAVFCRRIINSALRRKQFSCALHERNQKLNSEIQAEKRRLEHILSTINEVVWSCTADSFETIYINNACYDIYGFSADEIIGNGDLLFGRVHDEDKKHFRTAWRELLRFGKSVFQYRIFHKDGSVKYIKNEAVLRRDSEYIPRFINGFARDVTIQQMQLLKIKKQNEQLQEIAWIQSHKVRAPVASILGLTQLIDAEKEDSANREVIRHLYTAAKKLDSVIHEIVEISASQANVTL